MNLFVLLITNVIVIHSGNKYISATEEYMNHLGTKTPYRIVANLINEKFEHENCEAIKIWMLVRHGTRTPSVSVIAHMNERLPQIRDLILEKNQEPSDFLDEVILNALQNWKLKSDTTKAKVLTHEGENEMLELAERMQNRFPELFPSIYSNTTYSFKYTATQRTKASAQYFVQGLFGRQILKDVWYPEPLHKDPILRFYKLCDKWRSDVKNNLESKLEMERFQSSNYMKDIVDKLNQELRLEDGSLTPDDARLIYTICAFETAWNSRETSPWCRLLNHSIVKVLAYLEDLKYYYRDGYGFQLTYQQACPAFNDMLNFFDSDEPYPKSTVYFTHSGTILKMLAHLGLYNDNRPLLHTDFNAYEHQWRVSQIDPFGSNIALILNRCGDKKSLLVLHQERVVRLPSCDSDFCDLESIKEYYHSSINCNFDEICNNN